MAKHDAAVLIGMLLVTGVLVKYWRTLLATFIVAAIALIGFGLYNVLSYFK